MLEEGEIIEVQVEGWKAPHYVLRSDAKVLEDLNAGRVPAAWAPLETTTAEEAVFLAPLDPVSARGRAKVLFGFDFIGKSTSQSTNASSAITRYRSCGVTGSSPEFDSKLDRATNTLIILGLWLEDVSPRSDKAPGSGEALGSNEVFVEALARGFARFVTFLGASRLDAKGIQEPLLRLRVCASFEP